jgi:tRNA dimethylallyltransferase
MRDANHRTTTSPIPIDAVLIAGPTASGKSQAALALAQAIGGAVINADSMQVYRELRVLSARPGKAEEDSAPHLLYGHVSAFARYSAGRYAADSAAALAEAQRRGLLPIFTGGTGLYFSVLTDGLADIPPVPAEVRESARKKLANIGVNALYAELVCRDPETAARLRPSDPQRVLRAWEVMEATGKPLARWQKETGTPVLAGMRLAKFVVDLPRPRLRECIETRFRAMLEAGALEEAETLRGLDPSLPAAKTLGLRELLALGEGKLGREEAIAAAVTATRQFAKRQTTWLRHRMTDWKWIAPESDNIITLLRQNLS